jgi:endo-alpha-1,4-polygalactosaminidase (GH114 family)
LNAIGALSPSYAVIDYSHDGSVDEEFTRADIDGLRANMLSPARVISYMSIGEVESYRFY